MAFAEDIELIRKSLHPKAEGAFISLERLEKALEVLNRVAQDAVAKLNATEYEYGWAGDAQATTFYATKEEAEEYMGNPKRFARTKAGDWEAVE